MTTDPMPCDRCSQPHPKCVGHKRSGEPCGQKRMAGQLVCRMHGGTSPQALAAAERRRTEQEAEDIIRKLWPGLDNVEPVTSPALLMQQMAGALKFQVEVLGERVNQLKTIETGDSFGQLRAIYVAHDRAVTQLSGLLEKMGRLGIAQQLVQLERDQGRMVAAGLIDGYDAMGVTPEQRELGTAAFMARVRIEAGAGKAVTS